MEFNINSRQTKDILRGAPGYRPTLNAYMWADALAIARVARLAGDGGRGEEYRDEGGGTQGEPAEALWDPKRDFFFPMSTRDETDKDGNESRRTRSRTKLASSPAPARPRRASATFPGSSTCRIPATRRPGSS